MKGHSLLHLPYPRSDRGAGDHHLMGFPSTMNASMAAVTSRWRRSAAAAERRIVAVADVFTAIGKIALARRRSMDPEAAARAAARKYGGEGGPR